MQVEMANLLHSFETKSKDQILHEIEHFMEDVSLRLSTYEVSIRAQTEMVHQFLEMKQHVQAVEAQNKILLEENLRLTSQLSLRKKDLYGRSTEATSDLLQSAVTDENVEDPLSENPVSNPQATNTSTTSLVNQLLNGKSNKHGKSKGKLKQDLENLSVRKEFYFDSATLSAMYGEGNFNIIGWTEKRSIVSIRSGKYILQTYEPVISVGLEHELVRVSYVNKLLPHSMVSESLLAEIIYNHYVMSIPFTRQEDDFKRDGISISKVNMVNWCNYFSHEKLLPVYNYLCNLLLQRSYSQSDETTLQVINDGRRAGSKSYIWVHTTSELDTEPPIVVFCYELTRNTQHLRDFYLANNFHGFITSDAYCSYGLLEKEANGTIVSCGCLMHCRRKFYDALYLRKLKGKTEEFIQQLPEFIVLKIIAEIYKIETPLKLLPPDERLAVRQKTIKPMMTELFSYLRSLQECDNSSYSEALQGAVRYAIDHETQLMQFLNDPLIPCDNGYAERNVRAYAVGRRNWLFNSSIKGAETSAILYSLCETAKANGAHPYYYIKYLLEKLPRDTYGVPPGHLDSMVPWSGAYREYERLQKKEAIDFWAKPEPFILPKAPKQNRKKLPVA